jgi:Ca2+:H+ antiporter
MTSIIGNAIKFIILLLSAMLGELELHPSIEFLVTLFGVFVLADKLKLATEELSERLGENFGGLLLAFTGNLPEIMISLFALRKGMVNVVKASISGAIVGNLLFGLGLAIMAGGLTRPILYFKRRPARVQSSMVLLACCGLLIPALFHFSNENEVEQLSLQISVILITMYVFGLIFTFFTHSNLPPIHADDYESDNEMGAVEAIPADEIPSTITRPVSHSPEKIQHHKSIWNPVLRLIFFGALLAYVSEILTSSIDPISKNFGLSDVFMGVIVLSLAGNIGEYLNAISFARRGKIDLTIQATMGSATQVSLLVAPVLVFSSYFMSKPMNLNFTLYEVAAVLIAATVTRTFTYDGESHWFEGSMLVGIYLILGLGFYHLS